MFVEFHANYKKHDENFKKVKNHNLLSRQEIEDLTKFFLKQTPQKIYDKLEGIHNHANKLEYPGYLDDLKTLDTLKNYVTSKINKHSLIKQSKRKTILKSVILALQKLASFRRLNTNNSEYSLRNI